MTFYLRLTLILLLFLSSRTFAGEVSNEPLRLSLSRAVSLALENNADLTLSRNRVQSAAIGIEAARGKFLPSLQGNVSSQQNFRRQTYPGEQDSYHNANLQLAANINLFNGFSDHAGLNASRQQRQKTEASLQRQQQLVAFAVASDYAAVLSHQELVRVATQNFRSQQNLEQQIEAFYNAGNRSVTDYYQQQAATAQAEFNLADAQRNLQVSKLEILQMLGRTLPVEVDLLPIALNTLSDHLGDLDATKAIKQALISRSDLRAQQQQIEVARLQTKVARSGNLPNLDLHATTGTGYSGINSGSVFGQLNDDQTASIGLTLTIPIFDRNQTRTNVAQAKIAEADAAATNKKLQQQIGLEVGQAIADYQRAMLQLAAAGRQLDYARQALDSNEARYHVGAATWVELSTARTIFIQAQGDEVRARYSVLLQGLNIGYVRGDFENLLQLLSEQEISS